MDSCQGLGCGYQAQVSCVGRCRRQLCGRHFVQRPELLALGEHPILARVLTDDERQYCTEHQGSSAPSAYHSFIDGLRKWFTMNGSPECVDCLADRVPGLRTILDERYVRNQHHDRTAEERLRQRNTEVAAAARLLAQSLSDTGRMSTLRTDSGPVRAALLHQGRIQDAWASDSRQQPASWDVTTYLDETGRIWRRSQLTPSRWLDRILDSRKGPGGPFAADSENHVLIDVLTREGLLTDDA